MRVGAGYTCRVPKVSQLSSKKLSTTLQVLLLAVNYGVYSEKFEKDQARIFDDISKDISGEHSVPSFSIRYSTTSK